MLSWARAAALVAVLMALASISAASWEQEAQQKAASGLLMAKYFASLKPDNNGCMVCTLLATIVEGLARGQSGPIDKFISSKLCPLLPGSYQFTCEFLVIEYGPAIIDMLEARANPDDICRALKFCTDPSCHLFPKSGFVATPLMGNVALQLSPEKTIWQVSKLLGKASVKIQSRQTASPPSSPVPMPPLRKILPHFDEDGDYFSTVATLRGFNWRGQDCDDTNSDVYPGRRVPTSDPSLDYNCNGISGRDPVSGKTWKELYCDNSGQLGVAVMGGSACSHFAIPGKWVKFNNITSNTYSDVLEAAENELDWPHKSWGTGYDTWSQDGAINSIYLKLRERNLCNHRDYQQLGVNGFSSSDVYATVGSLARNAKFDHPMTVFHSPLGDDVCNMNIDDTVAHMTTPKEFRAWVYGSLKQLDAMLPQGSHVMFVGLVNGSILWDTLHNRMHPFGVTYPTLYSWLLCSKSNPCVGWLNPNSTLRAAASERAKLLSDQYPIIIKEHAHEFKNFDMAYYPFPLRPIFDNWIREGKDPALLIEPVDGFHPSTLTNSLAAKWLTDHMAIDHPTFLGPINPNNAAIKAKFGNQGGY